MVEVMVNMPIEEYERIQNIARVLYMDDDQIVNQQDLLNKSQNLISKMATGDFSTEVIDTYISRIIDTKDNDQELKLKDLIRGLKDYLNNQELIILSKTLIEKVNDGEINLELIKDIKQLHKTRKGNLNIEFKKYKRPSKKRIDYIEITIKKFKGDEYRLQSGKIYYKNGKDANIDRDLKKTYSSKKKIINKLDSFYDLDEDQIIV